MDVFPTKQKCNAIIKALEVAMDYVEAATDFTPRQRKTLFEKLTVLRHNIVALRFAPHATPELRLAGALSYCKEVKHAVQKTSGLLKRSHWDTLPYTLDDNAVLADKMAAIEQLDKSLMDAHDLSPEARSLLDSMRKELADAIAEEDGIYESMLPTDQLRGVNKKICLDALDFAVNEFNTPEWKACFARQTKKSQGRPRGGR